MKEIYRFIAGFYKEICKPVLIACTLFTALLIFLNFHFWADSYIHKKDSVYASFYYRYILFLIAFAIPYIFYYLLQGKNYFKSALVSFLIIIAPAIFSWKMAMNTEFPFSTDSEWNNYWNQIIFWPFGLLVMSIMLFVIWLIFYRNNSFFGLTIKNFRWKPYLLMLVTMIPIIAAASTQEDFLQVYPKINNVNAVLIGAEHKWFYKILYELAYGSDFITVELFFRGFLVLAFVKIAGKDAILPMACFYCAIHFGKPLGECISSYFGGMILGIVVLNTSSILGGLVVHLGIAWLMEMGGHIGNALK
jgi:hypothetical protein